MPYYAVASGRTIGIFSNWTECNNSVKGYKNASYKKFDTKEEAANFVQVNNTIIGSCEPPTGTDVFVPDYYVYTDGACSNNGAARALAGLGIFFGVGDVRNISKKVDGKQTNNVAELTAIIETYRLIEEDVAAGKKVVIVSDSEYAIRCVSSYGEKCYKKGWTADIPNKELVKMAYELYMDNPNIRFLHVRAHTNHTDVHSFGNDKADKLANLAIGVECCPYNKSSRV